MKQLLFLGILIFNMFPSYSQPITNQRKNSEKMEKKRMLGLRTTIYKVSDITIAKAWYAKAFGTEPYFDEPYYVGFNICGYELGLQPSEESGLQKAEGVVAYWGVEDIEEVYRHLIEQGATENEKPFNVGGELMTATVKDPWGNIIGLIYNPEFKLEE